MKKLKPQQSKIDLAKAFAKWDTDGNQAINKKEFKTRMMEITQDHPDWIQNIEPAFRLVLDYDALFNYFDKDKSGAITVDELSDLLHKLKPNQSKFNLKKALEQWDTDGSGDISKIEFKERMRELAKDHPHWIQNIQDAAPELRVFQQAKDVLDDPAQVTRKEFRELLDSNANLRNLLDAKEKKCDQLFDELDANGDGVVSWDELCSEITNVKDRRFAELIEWEQMTAKMALAIFCVFLTGVLFVSGEFRLPKELHEPKSTQGISPGTMFGCLTRSCD